MCQISIQIPYAVLYDTHMNQKQAADFARRLVAIGYYIHNHVSVGYCAQIAEMSEEEFIKYMSNYKASIFNFDDEQEFFEELKNA